MSTHYKASSESVLPAQLARIAEEVGQYNRAEVWAVLGIDLALKTGQSMFFSMLSMLQISSLLARSQFEEAIDLAREAAAITVALDVRRRARKTEDEEDLDVEVELGEGSSEHRRRVDLTTALTGLVPAFFQISALFLEDPGHARLHAQAVIAKCRELARNAADAEVWETGIQLLSTIFDGKASGSALIGWFNALSNSESNVLRYMAAIGASLQPDISLRDACRLHIMVLVPLLPC